ncbi:MAG: T9SS type A sorting domain-containing protein [Saprospiraceae bacterium]|nr:T9SS type A sorting domain-containing protein [Saprospiraceae bacterium]
MKRQLLFAYLLSLGLFAQAQDTLATVYRQYATQQYMKQLIAAHPEMLGARSAIEQHTFNFLSYGLPDSLTIQVVFHLIGNAANGITQADVQAQIDALNRDFNRPKFTDTETAHPAWLAEGFSEVAARPAVHFCLAKKDPSGSPTIGMQYVSTNLSSFPVGTEVTKPETGGTKAWEPSKYLNVWVAPLNDGKTGFAQMPGGPKESDGIVINPAYFPRASKQAFLAANPATAHYSMGRTLSHLVGSYLNLYELWNEDQYCADDYVLDTPIHNAPNYGTPGYRHITTCFDNRVEMTMNLMDNTDDEAQFMFTNMQMMRFYATLAPSGGPRAGLRTSGCLDGGNIGGEGNKPNYSLFPNPANDGFTVKVVPTENDNIYLAAFNELGQLLTEQVVESPQTGATHFINVNTSGWSSGLYLVRLRFGDEIETVKVQIKR